MNDILTTPLETATLGAAQTVGPMTVVPILGADHVGYPGPRTGLQLGDVRTYGSLELKARAPGTTIVPLNIGWIQKGAQNHALCRTILLGTGEELLVEDACCVQASQGGYLAEADQWFFVLPLALREAALGARGTKDYSKLWAAITASNQKFGESRHGHLEVVIGKRRRELTRYRSRFETVCGQTGALVFLRDRLVGLELTPSAAYFAELWPALACFTYGVEALGLEVVGWEPALRPALAGDLDAVRQSLLAERTAHRDQLLGGLQALQGAPEVTTEDRLTGHELLTVTTDAFAGQVVRRDDGACVYASVFARGPYLSEVLAVA